MSIIILILVLRFLLLAWLPSLMRDRFQVDGSSLWITWYDFEILLYIVCRVQPLKCNSLPYVAYLLGAMLGGSLAGITQMDIIISFANLFVIV